MPSSDKHPTLTIQLLEPVVYLVGPEGNAVLRGSVAISSAHKSYTLTSLDLLFEGHLTLSWMTEDKQKTNTMTQQIAHQPIPLFPTVTDSNSLLLSPGTSRCSFECPLPTQLPATIQSSEATVDYCLTATMQTCSVDNNNHKKCHKTTTILPLTLTRSTTFGGSSDAQLVSGDNVVGMIDSLKQFTHWCQYHIVMDKATIGQPLSLTLGLAPHIQGLVLENTYLEWTERRKVMNSYGSAIQHRIAASHHHHHHHQEHPLVPLSKPWQGRYSFAIPSSLVPSASYAPYYTIAHTVIVTIVVSFPVKSKATNSTYRYKKTIRFQTDMELTSTAAAAHPDAKETRLPAYHSSQIQHDLLLLQGPPVYTPSPSAVDSTPATIMQCT